VIAIAAEQGIEIKTRPAQAVVGMSFFREERYENPRLLASGARRAACANCGTEDGTTVAAHSNSENTARARASRRTTSSSRTSATSATGTSTTNNTRPHWSLGRHPRGSHPVLPEGHACDVAAVGEERMDQSIGVTQVRDAIVAHGEPFFTVEDVEAEMGIDFDDDSEGDREAARDLEGVGLHDEARRAAPVEGKPTRWRHHVLVRIEA
jgi:hypothetical protein